MVAWVHGKSIEHEHQHRASGIEHRIVKHQEVNVAQYKVVVGNIGDIDINGLAVAERCFDYYVEQSVHGEGRFRNQEISLYGECNLFVKGFKPKKGAQNE